MTAAEWQVSTDPQAMINWLDDQGHAGPLWEFTIRLLSTGLGPTAGRALPPRGRAR
jgi:hypothetical protein